MRSSQATAEWSMKRASHEKWIREEITRRAQKHGLSVYQYSNNGNHLHLLLRVRRREGYRAFIRAIAGKIAQKITGSGKGNGQRKKFWDLLPFTRIVEWGKGFSIANGYVKLNQLESQLGRSLRVPKPKGKNLIRERVGKEIPRESRDTPPR